MCIRDSYEAIGAYDHQPKKEIITIVDKNEYALLMSYIMKTDKIGRAHV